MTEGGRSKSISESRNVWVLSSCSGLSVHSAGPHPAAQQDLAVAPGQRVWPFALATCFWGVQRNLGFSGSALPLTLS